MESSMRREYRYLLTKAEAERIMQMLRRDFVFSEKEYFIRSLYFDTPSTRGFADRMLDIDKHRKLRLRVYSPYAEVAALELKQPALQLSDVAAELKQPASIGVGTGENANLYLKRSVDIDKETAAEMAMQSYSPLLFNYSGVFSTECYALIRMDNYVPTCMIEHDRRAFDCDEEGVRLTFDSSIYATADNFDLFSDAVPFKRILRPDYMLLEIKTQGKIPDKLLQVLSECRAPIVSLSKYAISLGVCEGYFDGY